MTRHAELQGAVCEVEDDIAAGVLNSCQRLSWTGCALPEGRIRLLPERMDREHFRAVQRSVFGAIRCNVKPDRVDCLFLGLVPVLRFGHPRTVAGPDGVTHTWRITGGVQARRRDELGILTLEWTCHPCGDGRVQHSLTARVEGYPSRFLPSGDGRRPGPLWRGIARAYTRYHSVVTCRFLRRLARWLESGEMEAGTP